jgi:Fe-S oxidoreductase
VGNGNRKPRFEVSDLISLLPVHLSNKSQKIACHNPCYLSKQGIQLSDELARKGFQIEEVIDDCCGAGGGVYFTDPDLAEEIARKTIQSTKSDTLVTGCPFCKEQFTKVIGKGKKIIHYIEALDQ